MIGNTGECYLRDSQFCELLESQKVIDHSIDEKHGRYTCVHKSIKKKSVVEMQQKSGTWFQKINRLKLNLRDDYFDAFLRKISRRTNLGSHRVRILI